MIEKIPIHLFHTQAYCEYQIFLEYIKSVEVESTEEMQMGKKIHNLLLKKHKKRAKISLSIPEAIKQSIEKDAVLIGREIRVNGNLLYGLIDEARFMPNQIMIIDDKPKYYPYISNKKQVWGYCLAFEEKFNTKMPIISTLRQRDSQQVCWKKEFTEIDRKIVLDSTKRILDVLNCSREPESTLKISKCRSCRLKDYCDKCN